MGKRGIFKARTANYDAIILDLMLPEVDGFTLLKQWRKDALTSPVLILTARGTTQDKVEGLNLGADDYLTKPFQLEELFARVRALIRRGHQVKDPIIRVFDMEIDTGARLVKTGWSGDPPYPPRIRSFGVFGLPSREGGYPDHDLEPPL